MGFYLGAFAFLVPAGRRRTAIVAGAVAAGAATGLARIAQGGHFLSDIVFAGLAVWAVTWAVHLWVVEHDGLARLRLPALASAASAHGWRVLALWTAATAATIALAVACVDKPLAFWMHAQSDTLHAVFAFITRFGISTGYLIAGAVLFVGLRLAARAARLAAWRERLLAWSYVPGFLFASLAASGLTVDLLKTVVGRSRPKLLFLSGGEMYSFGFFATGADHWSFPSGHTANATALAAAAWVLWPRGRPLFVAFALLIAASRIVITAHYFSDVVAGAYVAILVTLYVRRVFERSGIDLAAAKAGRLGPQERPPWRVRLGLGRAKDGVPRGAATDNP